MVMMKTPNPKPDVLCMMPPAMQSMNIMTTSLIFPYIWYNKGYYDASDDPGSSDNGFQSHRVKEKCHRDAYHCRHKKDYPYLPAYRQSSGSAVFSDVAAEKRIKKLFPESWGTLVEAP